MKTRKLLNRETLGRVLFSVPVLVATFIALHPALKTGPFALIFVAFWVSVELRRMTHGANPSAETNVRGVINRFYDYEGFATWSAVATVVVLLGLFTGLRMYQDNPWSLMVIALAVYANDSFAWLAGKTFGGRVTKRLFWQYSPSKTWEGTVGGALVTVGVGALTWRFLAPLLQAGSWWIVLATAAASSFGAIQADMLGSAVKRYIGVKDSSTRSDLWFGHGGWVDRFLALYGALMANAILLYLLGN